MMLTMFFLTISMLTFGAGFRDVGRSRYTVGRGGLTERGGAAVVDRGPGRHGIGGDRIGIGAGRRRRRLGVEDDGHQYRELPVVQQRLLGEQRVGEDLLLLFLGGLLGVL